MFNGILDFFNQVIVFLHLPLIPQGSTFGQLGYYAEIIAVALIFLIIINFILKILLHEEFLNWSIFTLIILICVCLIIVALAWYLPAKIDNSWIKVEPHL